MTLAAGTAILVLVAGVAGAALGLAADRLATRWPEHEPGTTPRGLDWRTVLVAITGAIVGAALVLRWQEPRDVVVLAIYAAVLLVLLATDLDQRLLPDVLTVPLIAYSAVILVLGWSPPLGESAAPLISGVAAAVGGAIFLAATDLLLKGQLGGGDLKLIAAIGLMSGVGRLFTGFLVASLASSVLLLALMALGRLGRRTLIPFGPVLIGAGFIAAIQP